MIGCMKRISRASMGSELGKGFALYRMDGEVVWGATIIHGLVLKACKKQS